MLYIKYQSSGTYSSKEDFLKHFHIKSKLNFDPWAWPHLWPQGHDLNKLVSPCPKDAIYISNIKVLPLTVLKKIFECIFLYKSMLKVDPWAWNHLWP